MSVNSASRFRHLIRVFWLPAVAALLAIDLVAGAVWHAWQGKWSGEQPAAALAVVLAALVFGFGPFGAGRRAAMRQFHVYTELMREIHFRVPVGRTFTFEGIAGSPVWLVEHRRWYRLRSRAFIMQVPGEDERLMDDIGLGMVESGVVVTRSLTVDRFLPVVTSHSDADDLSLDEDGELVIKEVAGQSGWEASRARFSMTLRGRVFAENFEIREAVEAMRTAEHVIDVT